MKRYLAIVAAVGLLLNTGCTTTDPTTGNRQFDEAKTAMVLTPMKPAIGMAVKLAAESDINTGTALRITEQIISNLLASEGAIDRGTIMARLAEIQISGLDMQTNQMAIETVATMVLDYYDILVQYVLRQKLSDPDGTDAAKVTRMVLSTIRDGINLGLSLAQPQ